MHAAEPDLLGFIRETILRKGPVTFAWFMEQALYHPQHGYYSSGRAAVGRRGDYFTSVSVGPVFGRLLAAQFAEMWELLGRPARFTVVEQGAHDGEFVKDVLTAARDTDPQFFEAIDYAIVEPFPVWQTRQEEKLVEFACKVGWQNSVAHLASFRGVHFSNELIDALPVHLVRWTGSEWLERHVSTVDEKLTLEDLPISNERLRDELGDIPPQLPAGYELEAGLAALDWIRTLAPKLAAGWILAVDYGYTRDELYAPSRCCGTIRCRAKHQVLSSPLLHIGEADITAHVDWTRLAEQAKACGLTLQGLADQHHFITGLLASDMIGGLLTCDEAKTKRAVQTLLHPGFLGMRFQFLALAKNVPPSAQLSGMRFSRQISGSARL